MDEHEDDEHVHAEVVDDAHGHETAHEVRRRGERGTVHGVCRHERRAKRGRNQRRNALWHGSAAASAAGGLRLDLRKMRTGGQHRQVLLELRRAETRCTLDLRQVWTSWQHRQVLLQLRRGKTGVNETDAKNRSRLRAVLLLLMKVILQ